MGGSDAAFVATAGAVFLALAVTVWALMVRQRESRRVGALQRRLASLEMRTEAAQAGAEAFDSAVVILEDGRARLASGEESLELCAEALGAEPDPDATVAALAGSSPDHGRKLAALCERGEPLSFEARGPKGSVLVEGRTAGVFAWLRLSPAIETELPSASRFAAVLDGQETPAWITGGDGRLRWANRAWLAAVGAATVEEAVERRLGFDQGADAAAAEAAGGGARRETVRWVAVNGQRRAFRVVAEPLEGGGAAGWALDVTEAEESRDVLKRHVEAHDETLNHLADAVAIFDSAKRLSFHNTAFADLWGLEPPGWPTAPATPRCWIAYGNAGACRRRSITASGARASWASTRPWTHRPTSCGASRTGARFGSCASLTPWAGSCCCSPTSRARCGSRRSTTA
jgi:PAS domain-containing protein